MIMVARAAPPGCGSTCNTLVAAQPSPAPGAHLLRLLPQPLRLVLRMCQLLGALRQLALGAVVQ